MLLGCHLTVIQISSSLLMNQFNVHNFINALYVIAFTAISTIKSVGNSVISVDVPFYTSATVINLPVALGLFSPYRLGLSSPIVRWVKVWRKVIILLSVRSDCQ